MSRPAPKTCAACGRPFEWRRKWARNWDAVKYCSARCRGRGIGPVDRTLEKAIVELLASRAPSATICPSEAARAADPDDWRRRMEAARSAARRLAAAGRVAVLQRGRVVDAGRVRGPFRIGRGSAFDAPR